MIWVVSHLNQDLLAMVLSAQFCLVVILSFIENGQSCKTSMFS